MTAAVAGSQTDRRPGRPYLAPVPDTEPPYDPAGSASTGRTRRSRSRQVPGALPRDADPPVPNGPVSVACDAVPSWSAHPDIGIRRAGTDDLPPPGRSAQVLATAVVEVLVGRRPLGQLRVHTAPAVFAGLAKRRPRGWSTPAQVISVRMGQPADGVAEVSATVKCTQRVHAMAFRIEGVDGRWRITALNIG